MDISPVATGDWTGLGCLYICKYAPNMKIHKAWINLQVGVERNQLSLLERISERRIPRLFGPTSPS